MVSEKSRGVFEDVQPRLEEIASDFLRDFRARENLEKLICSDILTIRIFERIRDCRI